MTKKRERREHWKQAPDEHDFPAAENYLGLLVPDEVAGRIAGELRAVPTVHFKAKDLLRASRLPLLPPDDFEVSKDLKRVAAGEPLAPVLLVRGVLVAGLALVIADGYHRICASYHLDEDADIPCRIAERSPRPSGADDAVAGTPGA
jgi:hypothetical protein